MKRILLALALIASIPAQAHGHSGIYPFIGGMIIGNILTQPRTVYVQPAPVYVQPAPVYVQPQPQYQYGLPSCRPEPVYLSNGQYAGQQLICN